MKITIIITLDNEDESEYDITFAMTSKPVAQTWEQPAEAAEFNITYIQNTEGVALNGKHFSIVEAEALDHCYAEMLAEAQERNV